MAFRKLESRTKGSWCMVSVTGSISHIQDSSGNDSKFVEMDVRRTQNSNFCVFVILISQLPIGFISGYGLTTINTSAPAVAVYIKDAYLNRYGRDISEYLATTILTQSQSLLIWGSLVGALLVKPCLFRFSRKNSLLLVHFLNVFSAVLMGPVAGYGMSYEALMIGRILSGITRGLGFSIIMIYVAETTCRERLGFFQSPLSVIIFVASAVGAALGHSKVLGTPTLWSWQQFVTVLPSIPYFAFYIWIPNTPVYLMKQGNEDKAVETLRKLRVGNMVESELAIIKEEIVDGSSATSLKTILKNAHLRMQFLICQIVATSPQFVGVQVIFLYSDDLLIRAGVDSQYVTYATIAMLLQSVVAFAIFIPTQRKFGTKRVFLAGLIISTVALVVLVVSIALSSSVPAMSYVAMGSMCVVLFGIQFGPQLTMMSLPAELTTADTRPTTAFVSGCLFWLLAAIISLVFPYSVAAWEAYAYIPFAVISLVLIPVLIKAIPETNKRTASQIQRSFQNKSSSSLLELFSLSRYPKSPEQNGQWGNIAIHKEESLPAVTPINNNNLSEHGL